MKGDNGGSFVFCPLHSLNIVVGYKAVILNMSSNKSLDILPVRKHLSAKRKINDHRPNLTLKSDPSNRKISRIKFFSLSLLSGLLIFLIISFLFYISFRIEMVVKNFFFLFVLVFINLLIISNLISKTVSTVIDLYERTILE